MRGTKVMTNPNQTPIGANGQPLINKSSNNINFKNLESDNIFANNAANNKNQRPSTSNGTGNLVKERTPFIGSNNHNRMQLANINQRNGSETG